MRGLQQVSHRLLVDMREYLSVYLNEKCIRKLAERFRGYMEGFNTLQQCERIH